MKSMFCILCSLVVLCAVVQASSETPASAPEVSVPFRSFEYRVHGKDHAARLLSRPDGSWYIVGWSGWREPGADTGKGWKETWWVLEVDAHGQQQRRFEFDGRPNQTLVRDATLNGGEIVVVGTAWLARVGFDGKLISTIKLRDSDGGYPKPDAILPTSDGHLVLAGGVTRGKDRLDAWLAKLTSSGEVVWSKSLDRGADELAYGLVLRPDGGMILAAISGQYDEFGLRPSALWLLHCDPSGEKLADMVVDGGWLPTRNGLVAWQNGIAASYFPSGAPEGEDAGSLVVSRISSELQVLWSNSIEQQWPLGGMITVNSDRQLLVLITPGRMETLVLTTLDKDSNIVARRESNLTEIFMPLDMVARDDGVFVLGQVTRRLEPAEQVGDDGSASTPAAKHEYEQLLLLVELEM